MPVSRSLFLCEAHIGYADARVDLYGIFNVLRPVTYPHEVPYLVVFAQLRLARHPRHSAWLVMQVHHARCPRVAIVFRAA